MRRRDFLAAVAGMSMGAPSLGAADTPVFVRGERTGPAQFVLSEAGRAAPLWWDPRDDSAVRYALEDLRDDMARVTGVAPAMLATAAASATPIDDVIVVGTLGRSALVDGLAAQGRIDVAPLRGAWEGFLVQAVAQPWPGVKRALVIAGSDRRGTVFGLYTLSEQIGVSPWYWWADVPVRRRPALFVPMDLVHRDAPVVRYRGIFINDEAPALSGWVGQFHGGFTHTFYARVYELLLRLRANMLWPAMWGSSFFLDDPRNAELAHERGIVMGTSHHEPMQRAHREWRRPRPRGPWNYSTNAERLREFWAGGIERMGRRESLVTIGMRGDGDMAMDGHGDVQLLERIVADQRALIEQVTGRPAEQTPQLWALYKEVQDYLDQGMRVPDDVILLYADDNWGNIRRLPTAQERGRRGGAGVYYHFDYVGGPRSYKWLNVTPLPKVWEQMHLAWQHGATSLWIVNVGDLKPMEVPTEFFLRYAWNPAAWPAARLPQYLPEWAEREFGAPLAAEIADLVAQYTRFNGRRRPEQITPQTFSLVNYDEAERVVADWRALAGRAERVLAALPPEHRDACYQLVVHPVLACANLNELYVTVARNRLHARQGRRSTTLLAERAQALFARDAELERRYHEDVAGGKWNHLMSQPRIGYTSWNQPPSNVMPAVQTLVPPAQASLGVMAEGSEDGLAEGRLRLPPLEAHAGRARWIELFSRGDRPCEFRIVPSVPWLTLSQARGVVEGDLRVEVDARWPEVPVGRGLAQLEVHGPQGRRVVVEVPVFKAAERPAPGVFLETGGVVAIEAAHASERRAAAGRQWLEVPGHGPTLSGMTVHPVTAPALAPGDGMRLEYRVHLFNPGRVKVHAVLAPTLKFQAGATGLRYAIGFAHEAVQVVDMHADTTEATWARRVTEGVAVHVTEHSVPQAGTHTLHFLALDAGVVLQRLVIDAGGLVPSALGPPESPRQLAAG